MQHERDESKERFVKKPGDVLSQWWTLGRLLRDKRRAASHTAVYWVIIDSRDKNTGICRASMRFIEQALDGSISSRETIKKAVHDLSKWGYVKPLPRRRRNEATQFEIPWVVSSRGLIQQTTDSCGLAEQNAGGLAEQNAGGLAEQNESYLHPDGSTGGDVSKSVSPPAAPDGLSATARGEGFEDCLAAYGNLGTYHLALAEWIKIDFDRYSKEFVIKRAASWCDSAKPGQRRMPLEKWIAQKRYAEADRSVGANPKSKKTKPITPKQESAPPSPANDNEPIRQTVIATKGDLLTDGEGASWVNLFVVALDQFDSDDAPGEIVSICCESEDARQQERGQRELGQLINALDIDEVEDVDELLDKPFVFTKNDTGSYEFYPPETDSEKFAVSHKS